MKAVTVNNYPQDKYYPGVLGAIANILDRTDVVAPVEIFIEMSLLARKQYEEWRLGRVPYIESVMQGNLGKIGRVLRLIGFCSHDLKMIPIRTVYNKWGKGMSCHLRFSKSGIKAIEDSYQKHFLWNQSTARKILKIAEINCLIESPNHKTLPMTINDCACEAMRILKTRIPKAKDSWISIVSQLNADVIDIRALARVEELIATYLTLLPDAHQRKIWQETDINQAYYDEKQDPDIACIKKNIGVAILKVVMEQGVNKKFEETGIAHA